MCMRLARSIRELNAALRIKATARVKHEVTIKKVHILDVAAIRSQTKIARPF